MKKSIKTLTEAEADLLLAALLTKVPTSAGRRRGIRNRTIGLLMLDAGLRVGEVVKLQRSDLWAFDHAHSTIVVRPMVAKTNVERAIPVTERLRLSINNMQRYIWSEEGSSANNFAFRIPNRSVPMSIRQVQKIIMHACILANIPLRSPHCLRHTFATRIMKQANIRVVQQLLGHSSLTSTQIYTHPDEEDRTNAIMKMENSTNGKAKPGLKYAQGAVETSLGDD